MRGVGWGGRVEGGWRTKRAKKGTKADRLVLCIYIFISIEVAARMGGGRSDLHERGPSAFSPLNLRFCCFDSRMMMHDDIVIVKEPDGLTPSETFDRQRAPGFVRLRIVWTGRCLCCCQLLAFFCAQIQNTVEGLVGLFLAFKLNFRRHSSIISSHQQKRGERGFSHTRSISDRCARCLQSQPRGRRTPAGSPAA
jgi:hypothetical protein